MHFRTKKHEYVFVNGLDSSISQLFYDITGLCSQSTARASVYELQMPKSLELLTRRRAHCHVKE